MDSDSSLFYRPKTHRWRGHDVLVFDNVRTFEPTPHGIRICESLPTTGTITTEDTFQPIFRVQRMREYYAPSKDDGDGDEDTIIFVHAVVTDGTNKLTTMEFETIPSKPICIGDLIQLHKYGTVARCYNGCQGPHTTNCRCRKKMNLVCQHYKIVPDTVKMRAARVEYNLGSRQNTRKCRAEVPCNEAQTADRPFIAKTVSIDSQSVPTLDDSSVSSASGTGSLREEETVEFNFAVTDSSNESYTSNIDPDITTRTEDFFIEQEAIAKMNFFESEYNQSYGGDTNISAEKKNQTREADAEEISKSIVRQDVEHRNPTTTMTMTEHYEILHDAIAQKHLFESDDKQSAAVSVDKETRESSDEDVSESTIRSDILEPRTTEDLEMEQVTIGNMNFLESEDNPPHGVENISESNYEDVSELTVGSNLELRTTTLTTKELELSQDAIAKMNFYESEYNPSYVVDVISAEKKIRGSDYGEVLEWTLSITDGKHSAAAQISGYDKSVQLSPGDRIKVTQYDGANWYYEDRILIQQYDFILHREPGKHSGIVAFDKNAHGYSPEKRPVTTSLTSDGAIVMNQAAVGSASCTNPTVCMQLKGLHSSCRWALSDGRHIVDAYLSLNGEATTVDLPAKTDIVKIQFSKAPHKYDTTRSILYVDSVTIVEKPGFIINLESLKRID